MRTAISIDAALLKQADIAARRLGLSRSGLFARAVRDYLDRQRREQMLLQLNEVYANSTEPLEKSLLKKVKTKMRSTVKDRW